MSANSRAKVWLIDYKRGGRKKIQSWVCDNFLTLRQESTQQLMRLLWHATIRPFFWPLRSSKWRQYDRCQIVATVLASAQLSKNLLGYFFWVIHIHFRLLLTRTWTLMPTWWWLAPRTAKHVYPWRVCIFCVWKQQVHVVFTVFQWPSSSYIGRNQSMLPHAVSIPAFSHSCLYRKHYFKFSISVQYSICMKTIE